MKFSEPTHNDDLVAGFLPIEGGVVNFLDLNNVEMLPGVDPNRKAMDFWAHIEQEARDMNNTDRNIFHEDL